MSTSYEKMGTAEKKMNGESHAKNLQECAHNVKEEIGRVGTIARKATQEQLSELQKKGSEQLSRVADFARERPLTSIAIAAAVGYLGAVVTRRSA